MNYRGTPRRVRVEDIEQLEDGPLCRYKVTEDYLLKFLRASPLPSLCPPIAKGGTYLVIAESAVLC